MKNSRLVLLVGLLSACQPESTDDQKQEGVQNAAQKTAQKAAQGKSQREHAVPVLPSRPSAIKVQIDPWHEDFPYTLHSPPRKVGLWYERNAQQAIEKVVANLSGLCSREAWYMAREFFLRHEERTRDLMIERLDEAMREQLRYDHADNILKAVARHRNPAYAPAVLRAAAHSHPGIRRSAYQALVNAGSEAAVLKLLPEYAKMSRVEQGDWIKAAARHLGDANLFPMFREMLTSQRFASVLGAVFDEAIKLPPKRARELFDPIWGDLREDLKIHVAGVLHAAGDPRGTARLRHALKLPLKNVANAKVAMQGLRMGRPDELVDDLLALTNEDLEDLNVLVIETLRPVRTQTVDDTLLTLTDGSRSRPVRQRALFALAERGLTGELDRLVDFIRNEPEGATLRAGIEDLVAARYGKAVPVLAERLKKATRKGQLYFIRMIARINRKESFAALQDIFMQPEYVFPWRDEEHSNVTFLGVQFSNLNTCVEEMVTFAKSLPTTDYRRRAAMLHALANLAGATEDDALRTPIYDWTRSTVFDETQQPQVRILALDYLRKDVRIADAMRLKARLAKEKKGMRQYFSDYLHEFF